jgi:hypothetical protein
MKQQLYTVIRGEDGEVKELQFWFVQGSPSLAQLQAVAEKAWPQVFRDSPERIVFEPGIVSFRAYVSEAPHALPLVEEIVPKT